MAPAKGRDAGVAMLKEAFKQRFGPAMQDVIDAEVESRLIGRDNVDRETVDAIERRLVAARREQRGGPSAGGKHSRSASASAPAPPLSSGSRSSPLPPRHSLSLGALQRAPTLARPPLPATEAVFPEPPYGVARVEIRDDESERSRVRNVPRYAVPRKPKLKPMDHWDLLISYDAKKHAEEQRHWEQRGKGEAQQRFRDVLDGQMLELRGLKEQAAARKQQERVDMAATVEKNKKLTQQEEDVVRQKRERMMQANDEMTASMAMRRQKAQEKKQRDHDQMQAWLASEKARKEQEAREAQELYALRCAKNREDMAEAYAEAARKKKAEQELDKAIAAGQVKAMDNAEANNRAAVQARADFIARNSATVGAEIAERDARAERELQEKIRRVQEEADRASKEDAERRQRELRERTESMLATLAVQVEEHNRRGEWDKEASRKQAQLWKEQYEEGLRKDQAEDAQRRQKRRDVDEALIEQIREVNSVHPKNFAMTSTTQRADVAYNRVLFEQLSEEEFRRDVVGKMLAQAASGKPGRAGGKLDPFPSVARYEGPIHELELQVAPV